MTREERYSILCSHKLQNEGKHMLNVTWSNPHTVSTLVRPTKKRPERLQKEVKGHKRFLRLTNGSRLKVPQVRHTSPPANPLLHASFHIFLRDYPPPFPSLRANKGPRDLYKTIRKLTPVEPRGKCCDTTRTIFEGCKIGLGSFKTLFAIYAAHSLLKFVFCLNH